MINKTDLKKILKDQNHELVEYESGCWLEREKASDLSRFLLRDWIKVILGVRRCGKSTLAHLVLKNETYGYINFDDERLIGLKTSDLDKILETLYEIKPKLQHLFFDEIQNIDSWELFVSRLKRQKLNITLTGSNSHLLSGDLATHLTGRYAAVELFPYSFKEFLRSRAIDFVGHDNFRIEKRAEIKSMLEVYMKTGGFPEMVTDGYEAEYLRSLFDKIISRDIAARYKIRNVRDLKEVALYLFSISANLFNYKKIADTFEIKSATTAKNYVQYLNDAYLLFELKPFSFKFKEQIRQSRKIYPIDLGMLNAMSSGTQINLGHQLECLVFLELKRLGLEIYFYQEDMQIDFIVKTDRKITELIQVCWSLEDSKTLTRETRALKIAGQKLKCKKMTILTWDEQDTIEIEDGTIDVIPAWRWLIGGNAMVSAH